MLDVGTIYNHVLLKHICICTFSFKWIELIYTEMMWKSRRNKGYSQYFSCSQFV